MYMHFSETSHAFLVVLFCWFVLLLFVFFLVVVGYLLFWFLFCLRFADGGVLLFVFFLIEVSE